MNLPGNSRRPIHESLIHFVKRCVPSTYGCLIGLLETIYYPTGNTSPVITLEWIGNPDGGWIGVTGIQSVSKP